MQKIGLVGKVLAGILASLLNVSSSKTQGWHVVVYEKGEVREE
jgi:hypothetical protein